LEPKNPRPRARQEKGGHAAQTRPQASVRCGRMAGAVSPRKARVTWNCSLRDQSTSEASGSSRRTVSARREVTGSGRDRARKMRMAVRYIKPGGVSMTTLPDLRRRGAGSIVWA